MMTFQIRPTRKNPGNWNSSSIAAIAFALVSLTGSTSARAENRLDADLFSEIRMSETVKSNEKASPVEPKSSAILGPVSLSRLLIADQISNEVVERSVRVQVKDLLLNDETGSFGGDRVPGHLTMAVDADLQRIDIVVPVRSIESTNRLNGAAMMALMETLSREGNIHLVASGRSLAFQSSLSNQDVTADGLRALVKRQATLAKRIAPELDAITETTVVSEATGEPAAAAKATKPNRTINAGGTPERSSTTATRSSAPIALKREALVGTWSARTSANDAWAIRFENGGSFLMVHTTGGKNSVSKGQFRLESGRLSLGEKGGVSLSGQIGWKSNRAFKWNLQGKGGKSVATLAFTKQ